MTARELLRKLSELREKLAAETDETKANEIRVDMARLEAEWRQADEAEHAAANDDDDDDDGTEARHPLIGQVEMRNYISAAAQGARLEGREAELNQDLGLGGGAGVRVPWEALSPLEERADTVAPSVVGIQQQSIIARIFARTAAAFLGVDMPTVGIGETEYVVMTGGTEPQMRAPGASQAGQTAATFATTTLGPKRLSAEYVVRIEDLVRLRGLEEALRSDLRMAFGVAMDKQVLDGALTSDGNTNTEQVRGLYPRYLPGAPTGSAPTDPTADNVIAFIDGKVDGQFVTMGSQVRAIIPGKTNGLIAGMVKADTIDIQRRYAANFQVSALIPDFVYQAKSGNGKLDGLSKYALFSLAGVPMRAVAPVWQGFDLIRDPYTEAGSGKVVITAHALWNFDVLRSNGFGVGLPVETQART